MVEAEKKFADSYKAAQQSMHNVIQNEQEYVMQIHALSTSLNVGFWKKKTFFAMCLLYKVCGTNFDSSLLQDYHLGCVSVLEDLVKQLK